ncbi:MAG: hypothetical protein HXX18_01860 [Bacteroidetes bacterium]|nr:hypothetical protein [Bacteroidota bacterium]
MTTHIDFVPKWLRILVGILALMNIAFGVMGYFDMTVLFPNGNGIDLSSAIIKNASFEFAARNLSIGLALMIVALKGVPESITIVTIIRALIEIQTIIIAIVHGNITTMLVLPAVLLIAEIFIIITLIKVIAKRDA